MDKEKKQISGDAACSTRSLSNWRVRVEEGLKKNQESKEATQHVMVESLPFSTERSLGTETDDNGLNVSSPRNPSNKLWGIKQMYCRNRWRVRVTIFSHSILLVISNNIFSHIKLVPIISHQPANITFLSQQICTSHSKPIRSRCCYTSQKLIVIYLNLHVMTGLDYEPVMQLKIYLNLL
jgi:hypothetical protein